MNCITIDDEPLAHKIILNYCAHLDFLTVDKSCHSGMEAIEYLGKHEVDLIFLDLQMPMLKGLDLLRTLTNPPLVIITTAHKEFALESYELDVVDYLLKPFSFERFLKAVNKAEQQRQLHTQSEAAPPRQELATTSRQSIFVKGDKKTHQVFLEDLLFLQSAGSYIKLYLENEVIITLDRLANYEQKLPEDQFLRVHKSYIVSIPRIRTIEGNRIMIGQHEIPIGQTYKRGVNRLSNG